MTVPWWDRAACAGMADQTYSEADPFHPAHEDNRTTYGEAKLICSTCPVRQECLMDALETEVNSARVGMRGGLTPRQRSRLWISRRNGTPFRETVVDTRKREVLHARGLSDREAARILGIDPTTYRGWRTRQGLAPNYMSGSGQRVTA